MEHHVIPWDPEVRICNDPPMKVVIGILALAIVLVAGFVGAVFGHALLAVSVTLAVYALCGVGWVFLSAVSIQLTVALEETYTTSPLFTHARQRIWPWRWETVEPGEMQPGSWRMTGT